MQLHRLILSLAAFALAPLCVLAQTPDARIGSIHVIDPAAPATLPGQRSGAIYLSIENEGKAADRLLSLTSTAGSVAIHSMSMQGAIMKMHEMDNLPLPPAAKVVMKAHGNYHLMLTGLKKPLVAGDKIPLTMTFERAGKLEVQVQVGENAAGKSMGKIVH